LSLIIASTAGFRAFDVADLSDENIVKKDGCRAFREGTAVAGVGEQAFDVSYSGFGFRHEFTLNVRRF
jgi:hypothetical protein